MGAKLTGVTAADRDGRTNSNADGTEAITPTLGANLNGRPRRLRDNLDLLESSNTGWVRAFFDVRDKLESDVDPAEDPDVVGLREAARENGCRLVVSLKWGFKVNWKWDEKESTNVPERGSEHERELFACATEYLRAIGEPVDVVVLGNEPMWETKVEDVLGENPPIARFTQRLKDYLLANGDHGTPKYLLGAFNRLDDELLWKFGFSDFGRAMLNMVWEDDDIDGIDLHVHYDEFGAAERMIEVARKLVPDGTITVTEFSPVFRYENHVRTPVGEWEAGRAFATEYGYSPEMTAVDYFELAKEDPRPQGEVADFYEAMPWYRGDHLRRIYGAFEEYGVALGTLGFMQHAGMRNVDWRRPNWSPFHINLLYQQALIRGEAAHPQYFEDYRKLAG